MGLLDKIRGAGKGPHKANIHDAIDNLRLISEGEHHVSEFYGLCGEAFPEDGDFWRNLSSSEKAHSAVALKMAELVEKEPNKFKPGRSFNPASIRLFGMYLGELVENVRAGKMPKHELLSVALDIEGSIIELNYGDIVETEVPEYLALAHKLTNETDGHKLKIEEKMRKGS